MPLGIELVQHFDFQFALSFSFAPFVQVQYELLTSQHCALAARQQALFVPPAFNDVDVVLLQQ